MPKTYLVPPAPPQNEGKTVAAWTFSALVLLGAILFALGMVTGQSVLLLVGIGAVVLAIVVGFILRTAGFGQKVKR
ncbi:hypothetical protein M3D48_03150 [Dermabacter vaginalis]|uniref:Uncharacterized protein n=1 Tax=Dermabacter vaginalis TaxID=1630135 RepID=A0A1B0ZIE5_9MICO|nr:MULTISPECIES: HGxxPAAW family protein [Dermabacter]SHV70509.1 Uncharacterised protein [Mycobacteroides abscessus subsp. abscessus]ANP27718.1 hypothetical protein DAD186_11680 [Dermabacter vaginalis]MCG7442706.1 hypothetical protein [Dermabacter vaginalis]MCT2149623.1 hypothetical protein [Dermabacter vaginalis]QEU11878.1 hypothetical protein FOB48_05900 [Dermabacter vaginalis]